MALLHAATITPTKQEVVTTFLATQPWATGFGTTELIGAYRFDDPAGEVGLETHLVATDVGVLQVPLTYRGAPLDGVDEVATTEHSVLGTRWVYDGCADPAFVQMLCTVTLTGVGQAAQLIELDGRMTTRNATVRLTGGSWDGSWDAGQVAVDGFGAPEQDGDWTVVRNPELELRVARRPVPGTGVGTKLTGTWAGQDVPVVLALVSPVHPVQPV